MHRAVRSGLAQRYGSARDAATYCGRGVETFRVHIAPLLHPAIIGSERVYAFDEVDQVMRRLALPPTAETPRRRGGRPRSPLPPA